MTPFCKIIYSYNLFVLCMDVSMLAEMTGSELEEFLESSDISADEPITLVSDEERTTLEEEFSVTRETLLLLYRGVGLTITELSTVLDMNQSEVSMMLSDYHVYKTKHKYLEATGRVCDSIVLYRKESGD